METSKLHGQVFASREAIDVVRSAGPEHSLSLLRWDGKLARIAEKVELPLKVCEPDYLDPSFLSAVRLPIDAQAYGSAGALVASIAAMIRKYCGLSHNFSRLVSFFVVTTWLCDCGSIAPRLSLVGPSHRGSEQLMKLLHAFCRHAVILTGVSPSGFWSLPFEFGLTVMIQQHQVSPQLKQALDSAMIRGRFVRRKGRFLAPFSPVIVHSDRALGDAAVAEIEVPLCPCNDLPLLDGETVEQLAAQFQGQLLAFRLANFER